MPAAKRLQSTAYRVGRGFAPPDSSAFRFLLLESTRSDGAGRARAAIGCSNVTSAVLAVGPGIVTAAVQHPIDFGALFDAAPSPELLISRDCVLLAANRAYLAATGCVAEDIVGKHIFEAYPSYPSDPASAAAQIAASIETVLSTGRPHTTPVLCYPVSRETPVGRVFENRYWIAVHALVLDGSGNTLFVSQKSTDVTDLSHFDAARGGVVRPDEAQCEPAFREVMPSQMREEMAGILRAERNQLQALFDQAPGFMAVLLGRECVFDTANRAYYELVGERGLLGRPLLDALPELAEQGFESIFAQVFDTARPVILSGQRLMIRRDPSGLLEERYVDMLYQPILADDGRVVGIFHQGNDVTEGWVARRSLAGKLEELAEERRRSAFQLRLTDRLRPLKDPAQIFSESAALITDHFQASRVAYGEYHRQQRKLTIHSDSNDTIGADKPVTAIPLPDDVAVLEHGGIWVCDDLSRDPRTAGPETWENFEALQVHAAVVVPLTHQGPSIACLFVGTATPRTWTASELEMLKEAADRVWTAAERVRAEGALRAADVRKDQFLAMLAHELRNPLAPIRAAADIQQMAPGDVERVRTTSAIIARQVRHMTSLVDDLLDVSRVTGGLVALGNAEVDVKDVLSAALEQVKPAVEARRHEVVVHHSGDAAIVCGDEKRLVQIFANVLNNAAKYTPDGGRIRIGTEVSPDTVVVRIDDTGIGMSAEVVATAFDLFAQAERTPDRAQGGLGIGLALVKRLVELHDGSVTASSAGTNCGSQFVITLPRLRNPQTAAVCVAPQAKSEIPLRVLVVDDNQDAASMLAMLVEASGHTAFVAQNARDGLRRAMDERPQVCLLDVGLPGMDGNELAGALKRHPDTATALLIAVTGYGHDEDRRRTADAGFAHHLVKPVDAAQLLSLLAKAGAALSTEC